MAQVTWTEFASDDLAAIVRFIAQDTVVYARRTGNQIIDRTRQLKTFPMSGRIVPEFNRSEIREVRYGPYRLIYRVLNDECRILAVAHETMDLERHMEESGEV